MELPDLQVHFLTVLGHQRREFINYGPTGQSIVGQREIDLLTMPLNPSEFFLECPGSISEPISTTWVTLNEFGVVALEVAPSQGSSSESPVPLRWSCDATCLFPTALSASHATLVAQAILASGVWAFSSAVCSGVHPLHHEHFTVLIRVRHWQKLVDWICCAKLTDLTMASTILGEF
jgi:hypothetical protein